MNQNSNSKGIVRKKSFLSKDNNGIFDSYAKFIKSNPVLSHEEIIELFKNYKNSNDVNARNRIINSNLRLVISTAKNYMSHGIPLEDLVQEGNIGLIKSVEKFEWEKGYKFGTYAIWWIKQAITQHILSKRVIRTPAHVGGVRKKVIQAMKEYKTEFGVDPDIEDISGILGTSETLIKAVMSVNKNIISLNEPVGKADSDSQREYQDIIPDMKDDPFEALAKKELIEQVRNSIKRLNPKELAVLKLRFGSIVDDESEDGSYIMSDEEVNEIKNKKELRK